MDLVSNVTQESVKDSTSDLTGFTYYLLFGSAAVCFVLQCIVKTKESDQATAALKTTNVHFAKFQRTYFIAYFLALFGDWLQGPYIYKLYRHYGFADIQIAVLYVVGFSASILFGTGTGALADRFGRKKMCMFFTLTYSLCCLMKLSTSYNVLLLGRLLGGISTSLLFSVFESWYVYEHTQKYDFPSEWISITFAKATFWNGVMAIVAGILANFTAEFLGFGPVSPFILAIPFFIISFAIMFQTWEENYGKKETNFRKACSEALLIIFAKRQILRLCIVQSLFECVMYVFVFLWTPILDPKHPPLGLVFSVFMVCIMIGSSIYHLSRYKKMEPETMLFLAVVFALISQCGCALSTSFPETNVYFAYLSFLLLEVAVGIYYPSIGYIKSEYIPEAHRASIMNWFRVPLNAMTCILLLFFHDPHVFRGNCMVFLICSGMMLCCAFTMIKFIKQEQKFVKILLPK